MSSAQVKCGHQRTLLRIIITTVILFNLVVLLVKNVEAADSSDSDPVDLFYPNVPECGMTDPGFPSDQRTKIPWIVGIYLQKASGSKFEYFVTGSLITSTAVLTVFGGGYGYPLHKTKRKKYYIPSPHRYLVVAGLNSTDLEDTDQFTQYANVSYVAPFTGSGSGNSSENRDYHLVILRLSTPFKFTTPYVRPICIPFAILPFLRSIGFEGKFSEIITFREEPSFLGGFNSPYGRTKGPFQSKWLPSKLSGDEICFNAYKFHYRSLPDDVFCAKLDLREGQIDNSTCLTHGSSSAWKSSPYAISFIPALGPPRWILNGPIGLIPRKERGHCNANSNYFIAMVYNENDWIRRHMICDSDTFPCSDDTCIPLDQLCDGKVDCVTDASDEDSIYCGATSHCYSSAKSYQCGFQGKCILMGQVGDGKVDCPHGNDEDPRLISSVSRRSKSSVDSTYAVKCAPISVGEGVTLDCFKSNASKSDCSQPVVGTEAVLSCARFYAPTHRTNFIKMKCYDDGNWKPFRFFSCEPECGLLGNDLLGAGSGSGGPGKFNYSKTFPWHASIFKETIDNTYEFHCGASLVERNVLLTAAQCLFDEAGEKVSWDSFRVVLGSTNKIFSENAESLVFQVAETWSSWLFDFETKQSDIAVIRLTKPVIYSQHIRPICYLLRNFKQFPATGSTGYITGHTEAKERKIPGFQVSPNEECEAGNLGKFCAKLSHLELNRNYPLDVGAGIVFSTNEDDPSSRFVLKGILSGIQMSSEELQGVGAKSKVTSFTHVDSYSEWLLNVLESIDTNPTV